MKVVDTTTIRHRTGTCPSCRMPIWADVTTVTLVGEATLDTDSRARVHAIAEPIATTIEHQCTKNRSDDL